jgi:hydroxymethylglutaryl-CoA reductase
MHIINGFSKFTRSEKLNWIKEQANLSLQTMEMLDSHLHGDESVQEIYGDLSENTISNHYLPLGLAPNFLINGDLMTLPMVIEESSVVAAASHAAKFWAMHGGFHTSVLGTSKVGQVHFTWSGSSEILQDVFKQNREILLRSVNPITHRMEKRGGGVESMEIHSAHPELPGHYHLFVRFKTADAMGANFINSVLEGLASQLTQMVENNVSEGSLEIIMSILSNYTPESLVQCYVEAKTDVFRNMSQELSADQFARKFQQAVDIAIHDPYRAVTHNKGIFNGMDALVLATGNDFRAVEACGHAYASRNGSYGSLSRMDLSEGSFRFTLEVPLAVGTVGGLTGIHPMARVSLEILGNPSAELLMQITAAAGLANNFSAIRSLITTGIQQGHMKMHLGNMLRQLKASKEETRLATQYFSKRTLSYSDLSSYLESIRNQNQQE